ncbi:MAG: hypothetical protein ACTSR7_19700, partial [Promethearchaeota archaeon]
VPGLGGMGIANQFFMMGHSRRTFGHELSHCLDIDEDEPDLYYEAKYNDPYMRNYMSSSSVYYFPPTRNPYLTDWQINSFNLLNKISVERLIEET